MEDFRAIIGVKAVTDEKKIQSQVDKGTKNVKINAELNVNTQSTQKYSKAIVQYYKDIEKYRDQFNKGNLTGIDLEIKQRQDSAKIFSNQIKSQMQERISAENKIQAEIKQTAKEQQDNLKLVSGKTQLNNNITTYLKNNTKASTEFVTKLKDIQNQIESVDKTGLNKLRQEFRNTTSEIRSIGQTGDSTFTKLGKNVGQFISFLSAGTLVMSGVNAIRNMVSAVTDLDKALVDIQQATGYSNDKAKELLKTYIDLGQQLGATGTEVANAASTWLRQGKSIADTNKLISDSMILSKIGQIDSADATKYLTAITKAYKISVDDTLSVVDKLSAIDISSATDVGGLAEALSSVATNAQLSGISLDKLLGYIAVVGETTQKSMSSVGTSFNAIFARMGSIKLSRLVDPETGEDLSNVETSLKRVGIALRDSDSSFRNFGDVLDDVSKNWNNYSDVTKRTIASSIAGVHHYEDFLILMQNYGKTLDYTTISQDAFGTALDKFSAYEESVEAKTKRLTASFQELASDTINSGLVKGFLDLANVLVNFVDKVGLVNVALVALSVVIGAKTTLGMTVFQGVIESLILKMGVGAAAAETLGMALSTAIPVIAVIGGITAITKAYDYFNVTLEENQATLSKQKDTYTEASSNVDALGKRIEECQKKLEELNNVNGASLVKDGEQKKLENQTKELQRQLDIEKEKQRIAGLEAEQTATKTLNSDINSKYNYKTTFNEITGGKVVYKKVTRDVELQKTIDDYNKLSDAYQELEKEQQVLANAHKGTSKEFRNNEKDLKSLTKQMEDARKYANDLASGMQTESESLIGATKSGDAVKKVVDNSLTSYGDWLNSINGVNEALADTQPSTQGAEGAISGYTDNVEDALKKTNDSIDDFQKSMETIKKALSDTSSLSSSDILDLMQQFPYLAKYGYTGSEGVTALSNALKFLASDLYHNSDATLKSNAALKQMYIDTITTSKSVINLSDAMSSLSAVNDIIDSVKSDMKDMGSISEETLSNIASKYPQLESLVAEYNAGIASSGDIISELSKIYDQDAENFRKANNVKLEQSESFYKDVYNKIPDYIKNLADSYGIDLKNYKNVALAKADINNKLVSALSKAWEDAGGDDLGGVAQQRLEQKIMRQPDIVDLFALSDSINSITADLQTGVNIKAPKSSKGKGKTKKEKNTFEQDIDWIAPSVEIAEKAVEKFKNTLDDDAPYKKQVNGLNKLIKLQKDLIPVYDKGAKAYKNQFNESTKGLDKKYVTRIQKGEVFNIQEFKGKSGEKVYNQITEAQKYWKEYQDLVDKVDSTNKNILENSKKVIELQTEELKKQVESLFSVIDKTIDNYNKAYSSINNLAGMYKEGSTQQIETYTQGINRASAEIKYLNEQIAKLNEMQKNGAFKGNMQAYKDELAKLEGELYNAKDAIQDFQTSMAKAINSQKDAVFDEREKLYDKQNASLHKQSDELKDILNAQKELLELTEKQHDYEVGIANRLKDINKIESRMAELKKAADSGDRKAQAELDQAAEDLAEKKTDLNEEQHDHEVDLQKDSLDKALSDNDKITKAKLDSAKSEYDDKTEKLTALYDKENQLIMNAANLTKEQFAKALADINSQFASLGVTVSPQTTKAILDSQSGIVDSGVKSPKQSENTNDVAIRSLLTSGSGIKGDSELNKYVKTNYGSYLTYAEMARLAKSLKVSGIGSASDMESGQNRDKVLSALKKAGFKGNSSTIDASMIKSTGEDGFALVQHGETILNKVDSGIFKNFVPLMKDFTQQMNLKTPNISNLVTNNPSPILQINLPPNSTITRDAVEPLKQYGQDILNNVVKELMYIQKQY